MPRKAVFGQSLSDSWFTSAPRCFTPVPSESFPVASQGEGGCRAVADSWAVFFPPALENLADSRAAHWLPSLPGLWLWAGVGFSTSCAWCLSFLHFLSAVNTTAPTAWILGEEQGWLKTHRGLKLGDPLVCSSPWIVFWEHEIVFWELAPAGKCLKALLEPGHPTSPASPQHPGRVGHTTPQKEECDPWLQPCTEPSVWSLSPRGWSCPLC